MCDYDDRGRERGGEDNPGPRKGLPKGRSEYNVLISMDPYTLGFRLYSERLNCNNAILFQIYFEFILVSHQMPHVKRYYFTSVPLFFMNGALKLNRETMQPPYVSSKLYHQV